MASGTTYLPRKAVQVSLCARRARSVTSSRPTAARASRRRRGDITYGHFKCNLRRLIDYPALWGYTRELHQIPGIAGTVVLDECKAHYYGSHRDLNPTGIIPIGPALDFTTEHGRAEAVPRRDASNTASVTALHVTSEEESTVEVPTIVREHQG
jgi:hypothetical protein